MTTHLVVVRLFETYVKGDAIGDAASIAAILTSSRAACVVRVQQLMPTQIVQGG